jgi:DNA-binding transcriptional MerR regulator
MSNFLTPAQLASKCGLTKRTVLYYNEIGLLNPKIISKEGDRLYSTNQIHALNLLKILRDIDITTQTIKRILTQCNYSYTRLYKHFEKEIHSNITLLNQAHNILNDHYNNPQDQLKKFDLKTHHSQAIFSTDIYSSLNDIPNLLDNIEGYFSGLNSDSIILLEFNTDVLSKPTFKISLGVEKIAGVKPKAKYTNLFTSTTTKTTKAYSRTLFQTKTNEIQDILKLATIGKTINKNDFVIELHNRGKHHNKYISTLNILL